MALEQYEYHLALHGIPTTTCPLYSKWFSSRRVADAIKPKWRNARNAHAYQTVLLRIPQWMHMNETSRRPPFHYIHIACVWIYLCTRNTSREHNKLSIVASLCANPHKLDTNTARHKNARARPQLAIYRSWGWPGVFFSLSTAPIFRCHCAADEAGVFAKNVWAIDHINAVAGGTRMWVCVCMCVRV